MLRLFMCKELDSQPPKTPFQLVARGRSNNRLGVRKDARSSEITYKRFEFFRNQYVVLSEVRAWARSYET